MQAYMAVFAAGALCSTVGDLAAWNRALATGRVVGPASWTRMTTPEGAARSKGYGYGLIVASFAAHRIVAHGGEFAGFRTSNAYLPDDSLSVTVLTNLASEDPQPLLLDILRVAVKASPTRRAARESRRPSGRTSRPRLRRAERGSRA